MSPSRTHLLRLLAVLLLTQWGLALLPGLRALTRVASAQAVELCTAGGPARTILLDAAGKPVHQVKPHPGCPMCCPGADPAILPEPAAFPAPPVAYAIPARARPTAGLPPAPPRAPPQQPRAPPLA